jgi:membrane dipeptidase
MKSNKKKEKPDMILCDTHADTLYRIAEGSRDPLDVTMERLKEGGVSLQVLALYVGEDNDPINIEKRFEGMLAAYEQLKAQGWIQAFDPGEAEKGVVKTMLSIEGCEVFAPGLHTIAQYREKGVRMAAVTWNYENALGTPACINADQGLKPYGLEAVKEMQRLNIAVDVSHLNIAGFYDILNKTNAPPLASHSCCRALRDHPRNLTDQQLKDLFKASGYVGLNFYPNFLVDEGQRCDINTLIDHIDHMHQLGGEGMVGFGSDFDGISTKPEGLDNPADFPRLIQGLKDRGYTEKQVEDIAGLNLLAYYKRI